MAQNIVECNIITGYHSDQWCIPNTIDDEQTLRGKDPWKFNQSPLQEQGFTDQVRRTVEETVQNKQRGTPSNAVSEDAALVMHAIRRSKGDMKSRKPKRPSESLRMSYNWQQTRKAWPCTPGDSNRIKQPEDTTKRLNHK